MYYHYKNACMHAYTGLASDIIKYEVEIFIIFESLKREKDENLLKY